MAPKARSFYSRLADLMSVKNTSQGAPSPPLDEVSLSFSPLRSALLVSGYEISTPSNTDIGGPRLRGHLREWDKGG
ncbi:hypothetical protein GWK47_029499 [Chionoecetes opilio]|uniref:Uncharacterized protein n=1 Tax=Chionoecetes opilio TaxID=41210 RepID=A0A8J4YY01_CHIOP|nr:hypothetical protein GWK47_029499 [Chionoecetes opilio]